MILAHLKRKVLHSETLGRLSSTTLRQCSRRHDVVAVQVTDPLELQLPDLGRIVLKDAETGEVVEINTNDAKRREAFATRQGKTQQELLSLFRSSGADLIQLRTDEPYDRELARFFENREKKRRRHR